MIVLENVDTAYVNIKIIESEKDGSITYYQGEIFQSQIDKKGVSTCAYVHVMKDIMMSVKPKRVLLIGCAGGSLATLMHREGCEVVMVDVNDYAFTLAKRYFQLPAEVQCVAADGYAYVLESTELFDAIAVDAFNGRGVIPAQMRKKDFFRLIAEAIGKESVVVMNVMTAHDLDREADRIAEKMQSANLPVVLYDWPGEQDRNTLVTGGRVAPLRFLKDSQPQWLQKELKGIICRAILI